MKLARERIAGIEPYLTAAKRAKTIDDKIARLRELSVKREEIAKKSPPSAVA
ncbi:MAG: hypothetical protein ACRECP_02985 [Methylocella sp.]